CHKKAVVGSQHTADIGISGPMERIPKRIISIPLANPFNPCRESVDRSSPALDQRGYRQQCAFPAEHSLTVPGTFMVIPQEVEQTVDCQERQFLGQRVAELSGLALGLFVGDDDLTQL